jgi:hypothetical protein
MMPDPKPCPRPRCKRKPTVEMMMNGLHFRVQCGCGWDGPLRISEKKAVQAWNERRTED